MKFKTSLFGNEYVFSSIIEVLAKANEEKSGDKLAGIAANSAEERVAAKAILAKVSLQYLRENPVVPYDEDEVTRIIQDDVNEKIYDEIKDWSIEQLREYILDENTSGEAVKRISRGLTAEMISGVTKLMSTLDLIAGAKKIKITSTCNTTIGEEGVLGFRLQPNHTTDNPDGITASLFEGLSYGMGDALIGLNPVDDSVDSVVTNLKRFDEIKRKFNIPTQICVLAHVSTQVEAIKRGAPTDLIFQSIAGSEKGNAAFGFNANDIQEAYDLALKYGTASGEKCYVFLKQDKVVNYRQMLIMVLIS